MFPMCDLTLVEMIFFYETLTLIILARHLNAIKLLPHGGSGLVRLKILPELLVLLLTEVKLFLRANWLLMF